MKTSLSIEFPLDFQSVAPTAIRAPSINPITTIATFFPENTSCVVELCSSGAIFRRLSASRHRPLIKTHGALHVAGVNVGQKSSISIPYGMTIGDEPELEPVPVAVVPVPVVPVVEPVPVKPVVEPVPVVPVVAPVPTVGYTAPIPPSGASPRLLTVQTLWIGFHAHTSKSSISSKCSPNSASGS